MKMCPVCEKNMSDNKEFCSIACELEAEEMDKEIVKVIRSDEIMPGITKGRITSQNVVTAFSPRS